MYYRKGPWIGCCIGCKCHQTSASVKAPPTVTQEEPVEDEHVYNVPLLAIPTMKKNKQRPKLEYKDLTADVFKESPGEAITFSRFEIISALISELMLG